MDIIKFQHQENDNVKCVCYKDNKKKTYVECALNSKKTTYTLKSPLILLGS